MNYSKLLNHKKIGSVLLASAVVLSATAVPYSAVNAKAATAATQKQSNSNVQTLKPVWEKNIGKANSAQISYTFSKGIIYYNAGTSLAAADMKTGKTKWTYKATPSSAPVVNSGYVFFTDNTGRLHKVNAKTGKSTWTGKVYGAPKSGKAYKPNGVYYLDKMMIVNDSYGLTAYDINTGKLKWKSEAEGNSGYNIEIMNGLILASSPVSGAITTNYLYGIDAYTGKVEWTYKGDFKKVLQTSPNLYIAKNNNGIDDGYALTIDVLEQATGKVLKTLEYQPVQFVESESAQLVENTASNYYFVKRAQEGGSILGVVPHNAANHSAAVTSYKYDSEITGIEVAESYNTIVISLADGRLVLKNTKTGKDTVTKYSSKISRFDILYNTIAIGLADGRMVVKNIKTGKDAASYKLGSGNFLETMHNESNRLIVQTGSKLYLVPLPAGLKL
ncbi:hypothetical protein DCC85_11645 [Paenibacillus sp. CAA11]|uniref:outer membrane protein assembly factor BamB family protein n=1 Tax=Paenibacillus sp. CAA11 TaxID=1532905 RepID=UPI000D356D19|nr:PQQ-binding-like beta-propeller repeat protein [Paenibacillus sp. CAA11]AWB44808.1 hypothetical protein DCC85_11645 [Paenibacillus sp. CAA11]